MPLLWCRLPELTYHIKNEEILFVEGRDGPSNHNRLCVQGRFGFDYPRHPSRVTMPLIRRLSQPYPRGGSIPNSIRPNPPRIFARQAGMKRWIWPRRAWWVEKRLWS